jgi:hypothetical protein
MVSLDVAANRATVFEAVLAAEHGWAAHADRLRAADPNGVTAGALPDVDETTTLADVLKVVPSLDELVHLLASAFGAQFGLSPQPAETLPTVVDAAARAAAFVGSRRWRSDLDHHAVAWTQLGVLDVYLSMQSGAVQEVLLAGDFIADSPGVEVLQDRLRGCEPTEAAVRERVHAVYADPGHFLLGMGSGELLVDTILRATGARR